MLGSALLVLVLAMVMHLGVHHVEEGCLGVYWRGGLLLETISTPGYHAMIPGLTRFVPVSGLSMPLLCFDLKILMSIGT